MNKKLGRVFDINLVLNFRGIGIVRAKFYVGFTNLVYNMCRLVQIKKYHPEFIKYN